MFPIDQGDTLSNSAQVSVGRYGYTAGVLDDAAPSCNMTNVDNSSAEVEMPVGGVTKELYAVDNVLVVGGGTVHVSPGSEVTYRLTYTLPTSDFQDLVLEDYLPLPIFDADDPDHDANTPGTWVTHFTGADIDASRPAVGHVKFGPSETFFTYTTEGNTKPGLSPAVSTNSGQNALIFDWASYYNAAHTAKNSRYPLHS